MLLRGPNPIYNYFWVAVLEDGRNVIPEFDLETGNENRWFDVKDRKISKVLWYPFSEEFADKVSANTPRLCVEGNGAILEMDVPEYYEPVVHRDHAIAQYFYYQCKACDTKIYWLQPDHEEPSGVPGMVIVRQPDPLECPNCGAHNEWYCEKCKKIVEDPILTKDDARLRFRFNRGEARCPICEPDDPQGVLKINNLAYMSGLSHSIDYILGYKKVSAIIRPFSYFRRPGARFQRHEDSTTKTWNDIGTQIA